MLITTIDAEKKLLGTLQQSFETEPKKRCYYISFSTTDKPRDEILHLFLKLFAELPTAYTSHIYICEDNDVFFFIHEFIHQDFIQFIKSLAHELHDNAFAENVSIFEIGLHWFQLKQICIDKISALKQRQTKSVTHSLQSISTNAERHSNQDLIADMLTAVSTEQMNRFHTMRDNRTRPLIQVLDDDQISRTLVRNSLNKDFDVLCTATGDEGWQSYIINAPDVLFLDIGLPDIHGYDLLEAINQLDEHAHVIMLTGQYGQTHMLTSLALGATGFVSKPFTRDKLLHYVTGSLDIDHSKQKAN